VPPKWGLGDALAAETGHHERATCPRRLAGKPLLAMRNARAALTGGVELLDDRLVMLDLLVDVGDRRLRVPDSLIVLPLGKRAG
jgi:hypothetical protein